MMRLEAALVVAIAVSACAVDVPDPETGAFACESNDDCTSDQSCSANGQGPGICLSTNDCSSDADCGPAGVCTVASSGQGMCHVRCGSAFCGGQTACVTVKGRTGNVQACKPCSGCSDGCVASNPTNIDYYDGTGLTCVSTNAGCTNDGDCAGGVCVLVANGARRECRPQCDMPGEFLCGGNQACALVNTQGGTTGACLGCATNCALTPGALCQADSALPIYGDEQEGLGCVCELNECRRDLGNAAVCDAGTCKVPTSCSNNNDCSSGFRCVWPNAGSTIGICASGCGTSDECPNGACATVFGPGDSTPTHQVCKTDCGGTCTQASGYWCDLGSYYNDTPTCSCDMTACTNIGGTCNANTCVVLGDTTPPVAWAAFNTQGTSVTATLSCDDASQPCSYQCAVDLDNLNNTTAYSNCTQNHVMHFPRSGPHSLAVIATDGVGNVAAPKTFSFNSSVVTWTQLSVGAHHNCAIGSDRSLWCWGDNYFDQVLGGVANDVPEAVGHPLWVGPDDDWLMVAAGGLHTCGIRANSPGATEGTLWCWGYRNGATDFTPTKLGDGDDWVSIAAGLTHSCALNVNSTMYCWGDNSAGAIGVGSGGGNYVPAPQLPSGLSTVRQMALGDNLSCAVTFTGDLYCWGANYDGQAGVGSMGNNVYIPTVLERIPAASGTWQAVGVGDRHACGISFDGSSHYTYCWGASRYGEAGAGAATPTQAGSGYTAMFVGGMHSCSGMNGNVVCWGRNSHYELLGSEARIEPTEAIGIASFDGSWQTIGLGANHSCGLSANGHVYCWGSRDLGQLGDGVGKQTTVPTTAINTNNVAVARIVAGANHACVIDRAGGSYGYGQCWGDDAHGQLGNESYSSFPTQATINDSFYMARMSPTWISAGEPQWVTLAAGARHTCAVQGGSNNVWCWGDNGYGQLGLTEAGYWRRAVIGLASTDSWREVTAGDTHSCGIKSNGSLYCWGNNLYGQLGLGNIGPGGSGMTQVGTLQTWSGLTSRRDHTCALQGVNAYCWGENGHGQIGSAAAGAPIASPQSVSGQQFVQLSAGGQHTCGIRSDGSLYCWGLNGNGQLGIGGFNDQYVPAQISGMSNANWAIVAAGDIHTCAVRSAADSLAPRTLWCWGSGFDGQLGVPNLYNQDTPLQIGFDSDWVRVATGSNFTCGVKADDSVRCWGGNLEGQLGDSGAWSAAYSGTLP